MRKTMNLFLGAALLAWEMLGRKAHFATDRSGCAKAWVTGKQSTYEGHIPTPPPSWQERQQKLFKRAVRRVQGRGTLKVKGHRFPLSPKKDDKPSKFWNASRLAKHGLCKIKMTVKDDLNRSGKRVVTKVVTIPERITFKLLKAA